MKMIKPIMAFLFVFALVFSVQAMDDDFVCNYTAPNGTECTQTYSTQGELNEHQHCGECGEGFGSPNDLATHQEDMNHATSGGGGQNQGEGGGDQQPGTCPECGHEFQGEEDHHGHCRECEAVMNDQSDWDTHCQANPEHCRPQEGDECHECEYVYTGDEGEDHGHCEVCKAEMNSPSDWDDHCRNNEGHCPDGGDGGGGEGPAPFDAVDTSHDDCINLDEAFAFFGQDEDRDEFANGNDEDPGFNDFANEDEDDTSCGNDQVNRKEFFKGTYRSMNQRNDDNLGQATMANCAAWCAGIPNYKTKDQSGEWSGSMARYDDANCPCHPDHDNGN